MAMVDGAIGDHGVVGVLGQCMTGYTGFVAPWDESGQSKSGITREFHLLSWYSSCLRFDLRAVEEEGSLSPKPDNGHRDRLSVGAQVVPWQELEPNRPRPSSPSSSSESIAAIW